MPVPAAVYWNLAGPAISAKLLIDAYASVMIPQSSTRTALAAFVPESSRGRRSVAAERSAS
jgi:hypothetical protein